MLSAQEIANYLVTNLDTIAANHPDGYTFSILAEIGKGYDGKKINGMVRTVSPEISPYPKGYVEAKYVFAVEMFVSGPSNYRYLAVNKIINELIKANQSSKVEFENGFGIITFSMGAPKGYKIEYQLGEGVPLTFTVSVTYTENGVTSADKHWLLDGVEIPFLSESVSVEREGIIRKIYTEVYSKVLLTGQQKFYTFRIPYESQTYKSLQSEILQAPAVNEVVHTLTYYDGAAFTQENPYTAQVSIYRSANSSSTRPNASAYEITLADVYNAAEQPLQYFIALIDFPFDMQSDDTRYFNSTAEQTEYFEGKAAASSAPFIKIDAPNLDGLIITKQVYRAPNPTAISQFDLVSKNYAIIKVVSADSTLYFYYFIQNAAIGADGCVMVDLKMDTVQTYFFREDVSFSDCMIERAHLNRFVPVEGSDTQVKFVTDPASKIYNAEAGLNFPKRLVKRDKLKLRFTGNDTVDEWLNEYVAYWVYIFVDPTHEYNVKTIENNTDTTMNSPTLGRVNYTKSLTNSVSGATNCICYPVFLKAGYIACKVLLSDEVTYKNIFIRNNARDYFEKLNNDTSFYYNIKISIVPPFGALRDNDYEINGNSLYILGKSESGNNNSAAYFYTVIDNTLLRRYVLNLTTDSNNAGLIYGARQQLNIETFDYDLPENNAIEKSEIVKQQSPNLSLNPKLNSQNFKELVVTASSGDTFAYDIQKLNESQVVFEYSEPITPEVTNYCLCVQGGTGLYADGTDENYTGLVGSVDNSLAFANDQYAAFIANNKNFFLQSNMKIVNGFTQTQVNNAVQAGKQLGTGNVIGAAETGVSSLMSAVNTIVSVIDRDMTLDNLKAAPDQLKNANGSVIFNMFITDLGLYVEKHEALEADLKTANDFMNIYGFTVSAVDNVRNFTNIRKYHNYIKAQLQSINGNLNNVARADLRQRFANGVRFWNIETVSYEYENYELWLEK